MSLMDQNRCHALDSLSDEQFAARWLALVGEPPSILLEDRRVMIDILVQTAEPVPSLACDPA